MWSQAKNPGSEEEADETVRMKEQMEGARALPWFLSQDPRCWETGGGTGGLKPPQGAQGGVCSSLSSLC